LKLLVSNLGRIDYEEALNLQKKLLVLRQHSEIEDIMLLLEHPPTLTLGVRANYFNIITPVEQLQQQGVKIYKVNRGGDVTYHGPGQIVGYPIINLNKHGKDVRLFLNKIEETFIQLLKCEYGITAARIKEYPGVWVDDAKITAIGVAIKRWVSMHGFAFNVNTNLEHFKWITPCGITGKGVTSLGKILGAQQDYNKANEMVIKYFSKVFNFEPEIIERHKLSEIIKESKNASKET